MGEVGEYWRDVKSHYRRKQKKYENTISPMYEALINHPDCKEIGDHWRIGRWDFWRTGTVKDFRTNEHSNIKALYEEVITPLN